MYPVNVENLHKEHLEWLSEIQFWKEEIHFLRLFCKKNCTDKIPNRIFFCDYYNQLDHHERLLKNLEKQIHSHENFLKEFAQDDVSMQDEGITDHDHNRQHLKNFHITFKEMKAEIYREYESRLIN